MNTSKMRYLVENYYTNLTELTEIQNKELDYVSKITATYGLNAGGGGGFSNSKTENLAIDIRNQKEKQTKLENNIRIVDEAIKVLDQYEREVIEKMKIYRNKLGRIAKEINKSSKYVYTTRKRALKKMCDFIGGTK